MKQIQLHTAALDADGGYRDGGSILDVGKDISADRAAELVAADQAVEVKSEKPAKVES